MPFVSAFSLISPEKPSSPLANFFDDGYSAVFTAHTIRLVKDDASTVVGHYNLYNGIWDIDITASTQPSNPTFLQAHVNSSYKMKTLVDLVLYLHYACFSPGVSTWTKATDVGYFTTWPGLT